MFRLYIIGLTILVIAIIANVAIVKLGWKSWYDFIELLNQQHWKAFKMLKVIDYVWLFIGYPLILGLGYKLGAKICDLVSL